MNSKTSFGILLLLLLSAGCHKEQPAPDDRLVGDWQWVRSVGGLTGKGILKPKTGETIIERFTQDGHWTLCGNGKCDAPMPFTLQQEKSVLFGDERLVLTLHRKIYLALPDTGFHVLLDRYLVREIGDTLRIANDGPDGYGETYFRK